MLPTQDLILKIQESKERQRLAQQLRNLRSEAFHNRICPDCGGDEVYCKVGIFTGGEKFTCRECGSTLTEYSMY
jgi:transposase-like protein